MDTGFIKRLLSWLMPLLFSSCALDEEVTLVMPEAAESIFVEAYMAPGALPKLAVIRTNNFQQELSFDQVEHAKVKLSLPDTSLLLTYKPFIDPKSGKFVNYLNNYALPRNTGADSLRLQIITATGEETLYAATALVEPVSIQQWSLQEQKLQLSCNNGSDRHNRYYSIYMQSIREQEGVIRTMHYDYTDVEDEVLTLSLIVPEGEKPKIVILYRITAENFHFQQALKKAARTNTDPFEPPVVVPTNIKGGLGIFTYFTADTLKIR